ncbi:MAG: presqualene diphosphate synthase HpnD [Betaproteobacteria bacterium]|nr:presqualene diphosphate synthase HpnD [Betaproteobacteria bacterium]
MTPDEYCQQKAARSGSSFYYSFLFLPPRKRRAIIAVYAFCREVDDIVDEVSDASVARTKLAWWRREVAQAFGGAPQHPVAHALQPVVAQFVLREADFQTIIDGMAMDLEQSRFLDFPALELYCHRVAGVVGLISAEILGYVDPSTRGYARDLGIAFQLTNIIRDVGEDARRGRIYLPQDDLDRFGIASSAILRGEYSDAFRALMTFEVERAQQWYDRALAQLPDADRRAQRAGLIMAAIYRALLSEIARDEFLVLDRRTSLTPLRKLWLAWKT